MEGSAQFELRRGKGLEMILDSQWGTALKCLLGLSLLVATVSAQERKRPSLKLNHDDLTVLGITIGSSTKHGVEERLGKAPIFKTRHEADAVCYRAASEQDDAIVTFYFGPLGGWTYVTEISISTAKALPRPLTSCKRSPLVSRNLTFLRGLMLGSGSADVVRTLGPPSHSADKKLSYYVSHNCPHDMASSEEGKGQQVQPDSSCVVVDSVEARFTQNEELTFVTFYHFIDQ